MAYKFTTTLFRALIYLFLFVLLLVTLALVGLGLLIGGERKDTP